MTGRETNEPTYPIDGTPTEQVAYISGLDERTIERLGGCEEQHPVSVEAISGLDTATLNRLGGTGDVQATHHAECWRDHRACAGSLIERLTQQVGELSQDLAYSRCSTTHAATQRDELAVKHARARQDLRGVEAERDHLANALRAVLDGNVYEYDGPCLGGECDRDPVTWCAIHEAARESEPFEPCGRGICCMNEGHEGPCHA